MTGTALVTGSAARVDDVARAIEGRGITVLPMVRNEALAHAGAALAPRPVEYYIQLPGDVPSPRTTQAHALAGLTALFGDGLLPRVSEVEVLSSKLAANCAVVLATGETVGDVSSGEYPHAPTCLLELLADAIVTDLAPVPVHTSVVSHWHCAQRIAEIALASGPRRASLVAGFAARAPEMSFDDWRLACLSASGPLEGG